MGKEKELAPQHCGKFIQIGGGRDGKIEGKCVVCGLIEEGESVDELRGKFAQPLGVMKKSSAPAAHQENGVSVIDNSLAAAPPKNLTELMSWARGALPDLLQSAARFIDKPATQRMIRRNLEYCAKSKALDKAWATPEGQESIVEALREAFYHGATMPEMGSIVPFGKAVEFVPGVAAFEFALTTGPGAPLKWIEIEPVHANDQYQIGKKDGNFYCDIQMVGNRGEVIAIVVRAFDFARGAVVGQLYEKDRLLEKAKRHSSSYRYYLADKAYFRELQSEGKLKNQNGRLYFEKEIPNQTWTKKVFEDELANPYEGPDAPEMLLKMAGKTFLRPYMKMRNAVVGSAEWTEDEFEETLEGAIDSSMNKARGQFTTGSVAQNNVDEKTVDVEPIEEAPAKPARKSSAPDQQAQQEFERI